jgi:hypothetical protein
MVSFESYLAESIAILLKDYEPDLFTFTIFSFVGNAMMKIRMVLLISPSSSQVRSGLSSMRLFFEISYFFVSIAAKNNKRQRSNYFTKRKLTRVTFDSLN